LTPNVQDRSSPNERTFGLVNDICCPNFFVDVVDYLHYALAS
jgi:hypothetical protein